MAYFFVQLGTFLYFGAPNGHRISFLIYFHKKQNPAIACGSSVWMEPMVGIEPTTCSLRVRYRAIVKKGTV